ncbi:alpha,alpha-trehalase nth1 [Neodidymelliopsis sp. IMI 364377]|nr:alpha,alpha-trehalase nth1 [Neodidymelliopsis sp. IMI 364377]
MAWLDELLAISLDRRFTESYEECLARAFCKADDTFLQLDFTQIPDIRNQTIDWALDSCTKLVYTPQRMTLNTSTYWTYTINKYQQYAEEVLSLVKHKAAALRIWWFSGNAQITAEPVAAGLVNNTASFSYPTVALPLGFDFDCDLPPPCRLVYSGPSGLTSNRTVILEEAVIKAQKEVNKWSFSNRGVPEYIHNLISGLLFLYLSLGSILMLAISVIRYDVQLKSCLPTATTGVRPQLRNIAAYLQRDYPSLLESCFNVALYSFLHTQLPYITAELDRSLLPVSVAFGVFHITQIVRFLDPTSKATRSMRGFCGTMRELYLLAQGHQLTIVTECTCLKYKSKDTSSQASPKNPASKIGARFISPLTTFSEDIQHERKIMHAEQGKQTPAELAGYATETDSEYESDIEFLSLPITTATSTTSGDESDWAVVEDQAVVA